MSEHRARTNLMASEFEWSSIPVVVIAVLGTWKAVELLLPLFQQIHFGASP